MTNQLDAMIALLTETIPANPSSAKGDALAKGLEKDLRKYFNALERAMPNLSNLYNKHCETGGLNNG